MSILGFAVPAVALVAVTNAVLQAYGRIDLPLISMCLRRGGRSCCGDLSPDRQPDVLDCGRAHQHGAVLLAHRAHQPVPYRASVARTAAGRPHAAASARRDLRHGRGGRYRKDACRHGGSRSGECPRQARDAGIIAAAALVYGVLLLALRRGGARRTCMLLPHGAKIADILHLK